MRRADSLYLSLFLINRKNIFSLEKILILISAFIILAIASFITISIIRRLVRAKRFKKLDRLKRIYGEKLKDLIYSGYLENGALQKFYSPPGSLKFQAIEDILIKLMNQKKYEPEIKELFTRLGYVDYYEKKLECRNALTKALAIDKLGKMKSSSSIDKIAQQLRSWNPEIITVAIRSLANIGTPESLQTILNFLPLIYEKWLITRKAIENAILKYNQEAIPFLIDYLKHTDNPKIIAIILDILSHLQSESALPIAFNYLSHENSEVRAKALKLIEASADKLELNQIEKIISLLQDSIWFVRLYALRVLKKIRGNKVHYALATSLFDSHWRVRNEAATALAKLGDTSLDIFLQALHYEDRYVQEIICEEIEKTGLVGQLIENLACPNGEKYKKSKEILTIMHSLNFSTPLFKYLTSGENEKIKEEINKIMGN